MINHVSRFQYRQQRRGIAWKGPERFGADEWEWYSLLGFIAANLLALTFFLSLGGALAVLGPWAILIEVKLLIKH